MKNLKLAACVFVFAGLLLLANQSSAQCWMINNTGYDLYVGAELGKNTDCAVLDFYSGIVPSNPGFRFPLGKYEILHVGFSIDDPPCVNYNGGSVSGSCLGGGTSSGDASCLASYSGTLVGTTGVVVN